MAIKTYSGNPAFQPRQRMQSGLREHTRLCFFLGFIAFLVYANTLSNGFAHDDFSVITKNTIVTKGIEAIPEILSTPYRRGFFITSNDLYRPLSLLLFAIEYQLSGGAPILFHVVNVLLFAACVILLFLFLDRLFNGKKTVAAFIAALLFAAHPVHTEVVANVKSADELLCFFFAFLSLCLFLSYACSGKLTMLLPGFACLFLSLLSKETVISFLAIIPLVFFFYRNGNKRRSLYITVGSIATAACYLLIRHSVLHSYNADYAGDIQFIDNALVHAPSAASRLATEIGILGRYLLLLLIPCPLVCDYSYNAIPFMSFGNVWVLLSLCVYGFLIVFSIGRLIIRRKDAYAFGILFFLCTIALFTNILFPIGTEMAERFVFFASVGFCWVAALLIEQLILRAGSAAAANATDFFTNKNALPFIVPVLILYGAIAIQRNTEWKDSLTLYRADIKKSPENAHLCYFLGNELLIEEEGADMVERQQMTEEAVANLRKAISIYPDYDDAHRAIGNGYFFLSQPDSAILHLKRAIALNPDDMQAMNNLNVVYFNVHKYSDAIAVCRTMVTKDPQYWEGYNDIGLCYLQMGKYDSATRILRDAMQKNNDYNPFIENMALAYKMAGNTDTAKMYEAMAQRRHPRFRIF